MSKKYTFRVVIGILISFAFMAFRISEVMAATLLTTYNTVSTPAIGSDFVMQSVIDPNTDIIYTLTDSGVTLVNRHGTVSVADDTTEGSYDSTFLHGTPMSSQIKSPIYLDSTNNILYVGTSSGLALVQTQGTTTISDDILLVNYTNIDGYSGSPTADPSGLGIFQRTDAQVNDIAIDSTNGLIYLGFYSGNASVVVIDTQSTLITADDVAQNYGDPSPSGADLSFGYVASLLLQGNVLYVGSLDHGSVSVVDTQGTADISDDVEAGVLTTGFFSSSYVGTALAVNTVNPNILYVGLITGVGVVNTQGTAITSDDVLVGTYTEASTPAILHLPSPPQNDSVRNIYFDAVSQFVFITDQAGITVIDTKASVTLADDTVVASYDSTTTPAIANSASSYSYFDRPNQLLYIATESGLSVMDFPEGLVSVSSSSSDSDTITTALPVNGTISITAPADVTMGAITGTGQSALTTNSATWNVKTNNASGYSLAWQASTAPMINLTADTIAAYTPTTANTPEAWSVASTDSEWGAHLASTSSVVDTGIWGTGDTYGTGNWLNVDNTAPYTIATSTSETTITGDDETVIFGGEIGASKIQPTGDYSADVTMTATTL